MQQPPERPRETLQPALRPARLIKHPYQSIAPPESQESQQDQQFNRLDEDVSRKPTTRLALSTPGTPTPHDDTDFDDDDLLDMGSMNTVRLMQVSGMMHAVRVSQPLQHPTQSPQATTSADIAEAWRPQNIPQVNLFSGLGQYAQPMSATRLQDTPITELQIKKAVPVWKRILGLPAIKVVLGLAIGIGLLLLISRFVNFSATFAILKQRLTTPQGIIYAFCAAVAFIAAFSIRGVRWSFFLGRIQKVSPFKAVQIFWVAVFMNFLLPIQGGELVKSLLLKRTTGIPINQSLPTVAMDRSLDLMPALFIMAVVPFLPGIHMNLALWLMLGLVSGILLGVIFVVALMAWNRDAATKFIRTMLGLLPKGLGSKIEGFVLGFVDSLLAGASNPRTFIPAVILTGFAITCDGLFAWMAFLTVGLKMSFGTAIFGYTTYNMFSILPTPPGQIGSNETVGEIVFHNLLGFDKDHVLAMFVLSHPLAALIMTTLCFISLAALGLSFTSVLKVRGTSEEKKSLSQPLPNLVQKPITPTIVVKPVMAGAAPGQHVPQMPAVQPTPSADIASFTTVPPISYPQMSPVATYKSGPGVRN